MRKLPVLFAFAAMLLAGCCATLLAVPKDAGRFAEHLGVSTNDVLFLSYSLYGKAPKEPKPRFRGIMGIALATPNGLHLFPEKMQERTATNSIALKYTEMRTAAIRPWWHEQSFQIHLETDSEIIVLRLDPKKGGWNRDAAKALFNIITGAGVPVVEAKKWYDLDLGGGGFPVIFIPTVF